MRKTRAMRAVTVGLAASVLVIGGSSQAWAANTRVDLPAAGYMEHLDPDPDTFKICDTEVDGAGVTGRLYIDQGVWALMGTVTDGGDAGCGYMAREITAPWTYKMEICWNGGQGSYCRSKTFEE